MRRTLIAVAIAGLFAIPFAASAAGNSSKAAASGSGASQGKSDGGAAAMFQRLDKNHDGSLSMAEVKGTPHEKEFKQLDKNHDGKLSKAEHASAPEHQKSAAGGTSSTKK